MPILRRSLRAMFPSFVLLVFMMFPCPAGSQSGSWWLPVDTVTSGPYEDHNPVMVHGMRGFYGYSDSWMVFERLTPDESQIAAVRYDISKSAFDTGVVVLGSRWYTDLQIRPDFAMLTYYPSGSPQIRRLAVWQCFKHGRWQVLYSGLDDSSAAWSSPSVLVADSLDNTDVHVCPARDSLFLVTWRRNNTVMGLFQGPRSATTPETLAVSQADSLEYDVSGGYSGVTLAWRSRVPEGDALMLRTVTRDSLTQLSPPETVLVRSRIVNPHLMTYFQPVVLFESSDSGRTDIFGYSKYGYPSGVNVSDDPLADDRNPRAFTNPVVTKTAGNRAGHMYFDVLTYEKYRGADSMLVFLSASGYRSDTVRSVGYNQNATVSSVFSFIDSYQRVPVVWESNRTGNSHIYARFVALFSDAVPEPSGRPGSFALYQNYPNPFNPSTTIRYTLPLRSHVTLSVFNTLGQQVAQLVNGEMDAGDHEVQLNAGRLASGVYFYRLRSEGRTDTKKFCLIR